VAAVYHAVTMTPVHNAKTVEMSVDGRLKQREFRFQVEYDDVVLKDGHNSLNGEDLAKEFLKTLTEP
jgi:hypothetical protein